MDGLQLELVNVSRSFGATRALHELALRLCPGRIAAIVGENGAGKSTALRLMAGELGPDEGEVRVGGRALRPARPEEAIRRGVGLVHQHFMLVDGFTALENLVLGAEPMRGLRIDFAAARREACALAERTGLEVDFERRAGELSVGQRQRLEILKVLYRRARAILLDEPSAVLAPSEVGELYAALRRLADDGATVAVVTHRLDEVVRFCDEALVMRRGELVAQTALGAERPPELVAELTRAIMGREPPAPVERPRAPDPDGAAVLELAGVELRDAAGRRLLEGLCLALRAGEIVGVAGVDGNGQRELVRVCAGLERATAGTVRVGGRDPCAGVSAGPAAVRAARRAGLVVVHEDRQREELVLEASLGDNALLGDLGGSHDAERVRRRLGRFAVEPASPRLRAQALSGGNQQKLVLGRAL
ncbi:MAG: ATP-binding cassette domain-containing protein, partial [Polyangiaceae bacterium]|nr:ATP-binding cassette domain-containing protein [Polyangiaceae bacterium]